MIKKGFSESSLTGTRNGDNLNYAIDCIYSTEHSPRKESIPEAFKSKAKDMLNLPGMGGIFNHTNAGLFHYAGNNPVRYIDPTGNYVILNESQHERTDNFIKSQHSDSRYLGFGNEKSVSFGYYFSDMYGDNPQQVSSLKTSKAPSITMSSVFGSMSSNTSEDVSMNGTLEQGFKFVDEYKKGKTRVSPKVSAKILGQKDGKVAIQVIINNRGKIYKGIVAYAGLSEVQTDKEFDKTKIDKIANDSINFLRGTDNETKNLTE